MNNTPSKLDKWLVQPAKLATLIAIYLIFVFILSLSIKITTDAVSSSSIMIELGSAIFSIIVCLATVYIYLRVKAIQIRNEEAVQSKLSFKSGWLFWGYLALLLAIMFSLKFTYHKSTSEYIMSNIEDVAETVKISLLFMLLLNIKSILNLKFYKFLALSCLVFMPGIFTYGLSVSVNNIVNMKSLFYNLDATEFIDFSISRYLLISLFFYLYFTFENEILRLCISSLALFHLIDFIPFLFVPRIVSTQMAYQLIINIYYVFFIIIFQILIYLKIKKLKPNTSKTA